MKKLLGIIASSRKIGNSEIVVKAVAEKMGSGWELSLIRLPDISLMPCKGCYACILPNGSCMIKDDTEWLLSLINEADAVICAAPNYLLGPAGILKMFTDRALQAMKYCVSYNKKPMAVALTMGREEYRGYADTALATQLMSLRLHIVDLEIFIGTFPGEVAVAADFHEKIERMANALAKAEPTPVAADRCPRCRSDLFRLKDNEMECGICRARAKIEGGMLAFYYFDPEFGEEGQDGHARWLIAKKMEYDKTKDVLKKIRERYRGGKWLIPGT
jgi:multimeric flavodoxin WrbA